MLSYLIADNRIKKMVWSNLALNWFDKIGGKAVFLRSIIGYFDRE